MQLTLADREFNGKYRKTYKEISLTYDVLLS